MIFPTSAIKFQEISDIAIRFDPVSLMRIPVQKSQLLDSFQKACNRQAVSVIASLPTVEGNIDPAHIDELLFEAHTQMSHAEVKYRLVNQFAKLLREILKAPSLSTQKNITVVDLGCGLGEIIQQLSLQPAFNHVRFVGLDINNNLVTRARESSERKNLPCAFKQENILNLQTEATIYFSNGVLHHFQDNLNVFFEEQKKHSPQAFIHCDLLPTFLASFSSWLYHQLAIKQALARHDGVLSAERSHSKNRLLTITKSIFPDFQIQSLNIPIPPLYLPGIFHALIGIRKA